MLVCTPPQATHTRDLVQKKMVYLYLTNYAEQNSEVAMLTVNTLQKDCDDSDAMIRGLALLPFSWWKVVPASGRVTSGAFEYTRPARSSSTEWGRSTSMM